MTEVITNVLLGLGYQLKGSLTALYLSRLIARWIKRNEDKRMEMENRLMTQKALPSTHFPATTVTRSMKRIRLAIRPARLREKR